MLITPTYFTLCYDTLPACKPVVDSQREEHTRQTVGGCWRSVAIGGKLQVLNDKTERPSNGPPDCERRRCAPESPRNYIPRIT